MESLPRIFVESAADLRDWLRNNHKKTESHWLVKWKKESGKPYISYDEVVDELICFGWVDSLPRKLDAQRTMLLISPRNPKSNWSAVNKRRVKELLKENRMMPPGLEIIERAKNNGAWNFLDDVENLVIPEDLSRELEKTGKAAYFFERFPDSSKRGILEWIKNAKREVTRQKRITETARKADRNIKANHPKGRDAGPSEDL